jgi:hypothetical protein
MTHKNGSRDEQWVFTSEAPSLLRRLNQGVPMRVFLALDLVKNTGGEQKQIGLTGLSPTTSINGNLFKRCPAGDGFIDR